MMQTVRAVPRRCGGSPTMGHAVDRVGTARFIVIAPACRQGPRLCPPYSDYGDPRSSQQNCRLSFPVGSARAELPLLADNPDQALDSAHGRPANMVEVAALVGDTARA